MKKTINFSRRALYAFTIISLSLGIMSCNNAPKTEDSKEVAEDQNEAKFDENKQEKDASFLVEAAEINMEEIQLGQLAQERSKNADVKALGKMMENEHTKALSDLKALAEKKQVALPATLTEDGQDAFKKLNDKSGKDFDKEYCNMMVDGHEKAIRKFEKASEDANDADIKAWASGMMPALNTHLEHAKQCKEKCDNIK